MGDAHYLPQPALSQVPGRGGEAVASRDISNGVGASGSGI